MTQYKRLAAAHIRQTPGRIRPCDQRIRRHPDQFCTLSAQPGDVHRDTEVVKRARKRKIIVDLVKPLADRLRFVRQRPARNGHGRVQPQRNGVSDPLCQSIWS